MKFIPTFLVSSLVLASAQVAAASDFDNFFYKYEREKVAYTAEQIQRLNERDIARQLSLPVSSRNPKRRIAVVDRTLANRIYQEVANNPVTDLYNIDKYDPAGGTGFCFGRAMNVHLESLAQGVLKESIMKAWVHGTLQTGSTRWRYHVTAILKGPGRTWWAIDPIMGRVMTLEEWYQSMKSFDSDGKMRIYFSMAKKFGPSGGQYEKSALLDDYYNDYFDDLLAYYREKHSRRRR